MSYLFFLSGIGLIVLSLMSCTGARTSINEIASLVMFLSGIICLAAGSVLGAMQDVLDAVKALAKPESGPK